VDNSNDIPHGEDPVPRHAAAAIVGALSNGSRISMATPEGYKSLMKALKDVVTTSVVDGVEETSVLSDAGEWAWRREIEQHAATCKLAGILVDAALAVTGVAIFLTVSFWFFRGAPAKLW
jgi:hypothetical protein